MPFPSLDINKDKALATGHLNDDEVKAGLPGAMPLIPTEDTHTGSEDREETEQS